ncbi:hypothetical protein CRYUN_Cryun16bG0056800 [Craigia yunnanensis]
MERVMKLQHFSHTHPLIFTKEHVDERKEIHCSVCEKPVLGPSYNCAKCKFSLHEICAKLPFKINHPFHRGHPLVLLSNPPTQYMRCLCDFCDKTSNSFVYHCYTCKFDLDISCALLPPRITGDFLELEHFSHKHQLVFIENHDNQGKEVCCSGCKELVSGPRYSCSQFVSAIFVTKHVKALFITVLLASSILTSNVLRCLYASLKLKITDTSSST